jgi:hypothetical protein
MKMKLLPYFLLAFYLVGSTAAFAQSVEPGFQRGNKEMHAVLKDYVQKNITPVMQQQRLKLEKQLTSADKKQIRDLRNRMAAARQQIQNFRNQRHLDQSPLTEDQQKKLQQYRIEMRNIRTEAIALAYKYDANIQALFKEVALPAESWRRDLQAITQKNEDKRLALSNPENQQLQKRFKHRMQPGRLPINYLRPVPFLLWDINKPMAADETEITSKINIYPNPVATNATLAYAIKTTGKVTIDLLDDQGKLLRNLRNDRQVPGSYDLGLNLSELKKGIYFLKITTPAGTETKRFLKN